MTIRKVQAISIPHLTKIKNCENEECINTEGIMSAQGAQSTQHVTDNTFQRFKSSQMVVFIHDNSSMGHGNRKTLRQKDSRLKWRQM